MAGFNEILVGRFNRFLQKLLSMKGPAAMNMLSPEMQFQIATENGIENRYLESWDTYAQGANIAAVAAVFGRVQLRNPPGTNVILVVEQVAFGNPAATPGVIFLTVGPTTTDLGGVGTAMKGFDSRQPRSSTGFISSDTNGAQLSLGNANLAFPGGIGLNQLLISPHHEIPIMPGQGMGVSNGTVNQIATFGVRWRERFLEESERQ